MEIAGMSGLTEWVEVIGVVVAFIVWLVRLEGKLSYIEKSGNETQKDVDELRIRHEALDVKIVEQLARIRESLARLEGKLGVKDD